MSEGRFLKMRGRVGRARMFLGRGCVGGVIRRKSLEGALERP